MTYQVQFQRTGHWLERSDLFETLQAAHSYAAQNHARYQAEVVVIVEVDDNGEQGRIHEIQVIHA
jgi:hypothetical protein